MRASGGDTKENWGSLPIFELFDSLVSFGSSMCFDVINLYSLFVSVESSRRMDKTRIPS